MPSAILLCVHVYIVLKVCPILLPYNSSSLLNLSRPGGDRIYGVFDYQLPSALRKLPLDRYLSMQNIRKVVSEADGYQPHLIAPEQAYRRLIDGAISYFRGPAEAAVDAVRSLLKLLCFCLRCQCVDIDFHAVMLKTFFSIL